MANNDFASLWKDAQDRYAEASGKDLQKLDLPRTTEDLIHNVEKQNKKYDAFRKKQGNLFTVLKAAVKPIELVGNLAAGAASAVFPPSSMCFGAVIYLINAAKGVSDSLDAIADLLTMLKDFTVRLNVYNRENLSQDLQEKLTEILTTVLEILARSTKVIEDGFWSRLKSMGKNVLIGNDKKMQGLVTKLDKLTRSEDRLVGAETLVETKHTARAVDAVQVSMNELTVSTDEVSAGVGQILDALEEWKAQAKAEKDTKHLEAVKERLKPSTLAQDRFDEIKREHVPGSGDWIRSEAAMQSWTRNEIQILWIAGIPGSGKSFLTYTIITYLQELHQDATGHAGHSSVGYYFFRDNKDQTRSFEQALRDISYQLAQTDQAYAKFISNVLQNNPEITSVRSAWQKLFVDFFIGDNFIESSAFILLDGLDEAFEDGRATFFEILKDVQDAGCDSRLHVAMLGRPQVIEEIADGLGEEVPTILVDSTKNGDDIAQYIELSIKKSPKLRRLPTSLKDEITTTLSSKAGGMFMWVKLMLAELSQKSRPAAVREALNSAPRGLRKMLQHVLEGFSASLNDEDAGDLNDMLAWVALAKRPLSLGEIDAMLRLKSPDGDGVMYLESKLRKQFASFFSLTREDALTTADLQAQKRIVTGKNDTEAGAAQQQDHDEGPDDVENETDFDSNLWRTTVTFSHASISDFLRHPDQGKVTVGEDHPYVGVELKEAHFRVAKTCIDILVDDGLLARMKDTVSLRPYVSNYWKEHLNGVDPAATDTEERVNMGALLASMMYEEQLIENWLGTANYLFFRSDVAKSILRWIQSEDVLNVLPEDRQSWVNSIQANPIELFEPAMKLTAKHWLLPGMNFFGRPCVTIIYSYNVRKAGGSVETVPNLSAEQIEETAEWGGLEQTAEWHRRLARVLRDSSWYDAAVKHFETSLHLDPGLWKSKSGIAMIYKMQKKYDEALNMFDAALKLARSDEKTPAAQDEGLAYSYGHRADCYNALAYINGEDGDKKRKMELLKCALEDYRTAFSLDHLNLDHVDSILYILDEFFRTQRTETDVSHGEAGGIPTRQESLERIMQLLRQLDGMEVYGTNNLIRYLHIAKYSGNWNSTRMASAAVGLGQLSWLQSKYREAIADADKDRQAVVSANLAVTLGRLYAVYGDEEARGVRLWEAVGTERITSAALASEIGYARTTALMELGQHCIRKALQDESNAEQYISKMEHIAAKRRYGARIGTEDSVPPNDIALYLGAWYRKTGRMKEAREAVKPHMQDAFIILSDDDPSNDSDGYWNMARALVALGDTSNALAMYYAIRVYEDGVAVIEEPGGDDRVDKDGSSNNKRDEDGGVNNSTRSDSENSDDEVDTGNEDPKNNNAEGDNDDETDNFGWGCAGACNADFENCDGMIVCTYCNLNFEKECFKLLQNDELLIKICGKDHEFLTVPTLTADQKFKEGETLLDGKVVTIEAWKAQLKKQYGL